MTCLAKLNKALTLHQTKYLYICALVIAKARKDTTLYLFNFKMQLKKNAHQL